MRRPFRVRRTPRRGGFQEVIYVALLFALLTFSYRYIPEEYRGESSRDAPAAEEGDTRSKPSSAQRPLPPPSRMDPIMTVKKSPRRGGYYSGTAFAIGPGLWLTARHVIEGCDAIGLQKPGDGLVRVRAVVEHESADIALLRTSLAGDPLALGFAHKQALQINQPGFMFGYPKGKPGNLSARLIGRYRLRAPLAGRNAVSPIIAWAEVRRLPAITGSLGGLSGGPVLDANGYVTGVTVVESRRRGRVFTAAPVSMVEMLGRAGVAAPKTSPDIEPANDFARRGDELRKELRVVKTVCKVD